jgi:hypothetical protein
MKGARTLARWRRAKSAGHGEAAKTGSAAKTAGPRPPLPRKFPSTVAGLHWIASRYSCLMSVRKFDSNWGFQPLEYRTQGRTVQGLRRFLH